LSKIPQAFWYNTYGVSINQKACGGGIEILNIEKMSMGGGLKKQTVGTSEMIGNERKH
jgi:hypothetical protein